MSALAFLFAKYIQRDNSDITIENVPAQIKPQVQQLLDEAKEVKEDDEGVGRTVEDNRETE